MHLPMGWSRLMVLNVAYQTLVSLDNSLGIWSGYSCAIILASTHFGTGNLNVKMAIIVNTVNKIIQNVCFLRYLFYL